MYGEMNEVIAMLPESAKSLATSPIRRMFSLRSASEKPRSLLRPKRMLSPVREGVLEEGVKLVRDTLVG